MRLGRSLPASAGRSIAMVCGALALSVGVGCGGGSAAQPTAPPAQVALTAVVVASPQRPPLTSPGPSPVGTGAASVTTAATSTTNAASPGASVGPGSEQTYEVQSGDTLLSIADQFYGDVTKWRGIYDANKDVIGDNPDALKIGMKLKIPPKQS